MNIAITGGHITPAFEFARYAKQQGDIILCIGNQKPKSFEVEQISQLDIAYKYLIAPKYDRFQKGKALATAPLLITSIVQAKKMLKQHHIQVVVGFGSYVAFPVSVAAWLLKIPVILHEQTRAPGIANRLISKIATKCAVSYPETKRYFPKNKSEVTGNVIRKSIWYPPVTPPSEIDSISAPYIFITGGNLGAAVLVNAAVPLANQFSNLTVIVQSGKNHITQNTLKANNLISRPWFNEAEMAWLLHHSHLIIARGGANTIAEIMVAGKPSIIVPLPRAANNEQAVNGQIIAKKHAGMIVYQSNELAEHLKAAVSAILADYQTYANNAQELNTQQSPTAVVKLYQLANDSLIPSQS